MSSIGEEVRKRLEAEDALVTGIANSLRETRALTEPSAFFSDVFKDHKTPWSNIPRLPSNFRRSTANIKRQVDIATHLVMGEAPIIDLEPLTESDFELQYGMRIRDVEQLAEASRLYVNLYVRDPAEWENKDLEHLVGLVRKSFSMGVRADGYFRSANPKYHDIISNRVDTFSAVASRAKESQPEEYSKLKAVTRGDERRIWMNMAIWWAYLSSIGSFLCDDLDEKLEQFGLVDVFWRLQLRKFLYASPISAAAGGQFYIDSMALEEFARRPEEKDRIAIAEAKFRDRDRDAVTAFVARQLTALEPTDLFSYELADAQFKNLERFLVQCEDDQIKLKINQAIGVILGALRNGEIPTSGFSDLSKYYAEQVRRVEENKLGRRAGKIAGIGAPVALGTYLTEPLVTYLFGFAVPIWASLAGGTAGGLLGLFAEGRIKPMLSQELVLATLYPTPFKLYELKNLSNRSNI